MYELTTSNFTIPADTGCKLHVHKMFRRRPGRLLNVLCRFNLRPVSTGILVSVSTSLSYLFNSIFNQCFTSIPPENIKKGGIEVEQLLKMGQ